VTLTMSLMPVAPIPPRPAQPEEPIMTVRPETYPQWLAARAAQRVNAHAHRQHIVQTIEWMIGARAATALRDRVEAYAAVHREHTSAVSSREPEFAVA
jgi:hypothetical protein